MTCCNLINNIEIRTLKANRFKNQSSDRHYNHQQEEFIKQKTFALHHRGFTLKFPKHCYCDRYYR